MPWFLFFLDDKGTEHAGGPYHSPGRAQEKLDTIEGDGEVVHYSVNTLEEAIQKRKERKVEEVGAHEGTRNIRHIKEIV